MNSLNELSESSRPAATQQPMRMRPSPIATCPSPSYHAIARRRRRRGRTDSIRPRSISHQKRRRRQRRKEVASKPEPEKMKTFDPWPVFFRREWRRNWPFLTGFAITGFLITKMTANFTEEDLKNSKFVQEHKRH